MRFLAAPLLALTLACGDKADVGEVLTCQANRRTFAAPQRALDVLLVIDSSEAMESYRQPLAALAADLGAVLSFGQLSLQVAVASADGSLPPVLLTGQDCVSDSVPFVYDFREPWWRCGPTRADRCGVANYEFSLGQAIGCASELELVGTRAPTPLSVVGRLLAAEEPGATPFLRDDADLAVIVIAAADDASSVEVAETIATLTAAKGRRGFVVTLAVAPLDSPRLRAFTDATRGRLVNIVDADWGDVLSTFGDLGDWVPGTCLAETIERRDIDADVPGLQLACSAELETEEALVVVPPCAMLTPQRPHPETALPCYWFEPFEPGCDYIQFVELPPSSSPGTFKLACEAQCPSP